MASPSVSATSGANPDNRFIRLPITYGRRKFPHVFCRVIESVRDSAFGSAFEGPLYAPGAVIQSLPPSGLVIEHAGPAGPKRNETLWILWKWTADGWQELSRMSAVNWEWTVAFRPICERWLYPPAGLHDILARSRSVAAEALDLVTVRIQREDSAVRRHVWASLYDQSAGRLVEE